MEFLHLYLRHPITRNPRVALQNVSCFLRLYAYEKQQHYKELSSLERVQGRYKKIYDAQSKFLNQSVYKEVIQN